MQGTASALCARHRRRLTLLVLVLGSILVLWAGPIRPGIVLGESMSPTFHSGQVFLMSRVRGANAVGPGDAVVVNVDGQFYLKRVFAVGGQTIWGLDSTDVEGAPDIILSPDDLDRIREVARNRPGVGRVVHIRVPPRHVYVLGDADGNSYDSRHFGPVPVDAIRGRVLVARLFHLWRPTPSGPRVVMASPGRRPAGGER